MTQSHIDEPGRVRQPNTGDVSASELMLSTKKHVIFELMKDPILRPHNYDCTLFVNYFIKADWSTVPMYHGVDAENRCILGALTCSHQLFIYGRRNRRYSDFEDHWVEPWKKLIDITSVYNKELLKTWESSTESEETNLEIYRNRLYEIAILDFIWLPDWELNPEYKHTDETKGAFSTLLMTFHANGDACLWNIKASKSARPSFSPRLLYKKRLISGDSFSKVSYSYISPSLGLLVVGTNKGKLIAYRLQKLNVKIEIQDGNDSIRYEQYLIHDGEDLWGDEDMIRIESIFLRPESSGRTKVTVAAVKHPNILMASSLAVLSLKVVCEEFSILKVPNGPIVGVTENADGYLVLAHEPGVLSLASYNNGVLEYIPESRNMIYDARIVKKRIDINYGTVQNLPRAKKENITDVKLKQLLFQGVGISRNQSLLCVTRTVSSFYDHLRLRRPSHIVFYSLLPEDITWSYVQKLYAENNYSLRAVSDVLVPFRFQLMGEGGDALYDEIFRWALPLSEKSTPELQLLYWCIKVRPGPSENEWRIADAEKQFDSRYYKKLSGRVALNSYRADVVADRIMQRRCASLIKAVSEHQDESIFSLDIEDNKQCLKAMYEFMLSKEEPLPIPPLPEFDPLPYIPICHWCKGPLEFPLETPNYLLQFEHVLEEFRTDFDAERISGFKWKSRRHPVKDYGFHKPEICILSFLPIELPFRKCPNCFTICRMKPAFGQRPFCPLCEGYMYPIHMPELVPVTEDDFEPDQRREESEKQLLASAEKFSLPKLDAFVPEVYVKEEPMDVPYFEEQEVDFANLPRLEPNEMLVSTEDPLDEWMQGFEVEEEVPFSEHGTDSGPDSKSSGSNAEASSSNESGDEGDGSENADDSDNSKASDSS